MALYYTKKYINTIRKTNSNFYILKCDIKKYFYNIDHEILLNKLKLDIKDKYIYNLIEEIINSTNKLYINNIIDNIIYIEKNKYKDNNINIKDLDNLPRYKYNKGLPIGNMSSQILAIYYLNELDHYIKEKLHIKYYIRYMDDFILIHEDKEYLKYCKDKIINILSNLKLELNNKTSIISINNGFIFLGYRFIIKNNRLIILIRSKTKNNIIRKFKYINKYKPNNSKEVLSSYNGYFMDTCSSYFCYKNNIKYKKRKKILDLYEYLNLDKNNNL